MNPEHSAVGDDRHHKLKQPAAHVYPLWHVPHLAHHPHTRAGIPAQCINVDRENASRWVNVVEVFSGNSVTDEEPAISANSWRYLLTTASSTVVSYAV